MLKIYHNPRCRKSREALQLLHDKGLEPEIIEYLKKPPTTAQLESLVKKSGSSVSEFVRTGEIEYKEHFKHSNMNDKAWIRALANYPKLLQRPVIESSDHAIIARDTGKLEHWLQRIK